MITVSATAASVLAGSGFVYKVAVESWLGGVLLAASVPVTTGGEETDRALNVPERVTFTVPRWVDNVDWAPQTAASPLAAKGQRLHVKLGIGLANGVTEWITRGRFIIYNSVPDEVSVQVTAVGMLHWIDQARLISPYQPTGTIASTLRGLVEPALTILVDGTLVDRTVPAAINFDEDRLGAVHEVLDAWPARGYVDPEGYLQVVPVTQSTTPVLALSDAYGGTVITAAGASSREGGANAIVARGTASDGSQVQGVAYMVVGPDAYGGAYNPLAVPFFFQSPLLTTVGQCQAAADTIRRRRQLQTGREFEVSMVPHPAVQVGDVVALTSADNGLAAELCSVEHLSLPYVAPEGAMPAMILTCRTLA
jgi:hypothetical protein